MSMNRAKAMACWAKALEGADLRIAEEKARREKRDAKNAKLARKRGLDKKR